MKYAIIPLVLVLFFVTQSCEKPERTRLNKYEIELVDSLYAKRVGATRKEADSICEAQYELIFDETVDSLKVVYLREIEEILNGEG